MDGRKKEKIIMVLLAVVFIYGALIRILSASGNFSMDEIWSLTTVQQKARTVWDIFRITHDNNHILNSIVMFLVGNLKIFQLYRIPALLGGLIAAFLAFKISRRQGTATCVFTTILFFLSFPLVFYSSEARGYGPLMACVMGCLYFGLKILNEQEWGWKNILAVWVICVLGFLSHLTFIHFYSAFVVWTIAALQTSANPFPHKIKKFFQLHALPGLFFAYLYFAFISKIIIGGGPVVPLISILQNLFLYSLGGPWLSHFIWARPIVIGAFLAFCLILGFQYKNDPPLRIFFAWGIFCSPALLLLIKSPAYLYVRYFLVSVILLLFLYGAFLGKMYQTNTFTRVVSLILLFIFIAGQSQYLYAFLGNGRGHYDQAVRFMLEHSQSEPITVGSDFDFRNEMVFDFYKRREPDGNRLRYLQRPELTKEIPEFFLFHIIGKPIKPPLHISYTLNDSIVKHRFVKFFSYGQAFSGWHWYLYQLEP